jgi:hypothetical protein
LQNQLRLAKHLNFIEGGTCGSLLSNLKSVRQMLTTFLQPVRGTRISVGPLHGILANRERREAKSLPPLPQAGSPC